MLRHPNWTSIRAIYTRLPIDTSKIASSDLDNWIYQAVSILRIKSQYAIKIATAKVEDNKAELPCDLVQMRAVKYMEERDIRLADIDSLCSCIDDKDLECIDDSEVISDNYDPTKLGSVISHYKNTTKVESDRTSESDSPLFNAFGITTSEFFNRYRLANRGVVYHPEFIYGTFCQSHFYNHCWRWMQMSDKAFTGKFHCKDCGNFHQPHCPHTYSFDSCGHLLTTMKEGFICYDYLGRVMDEDGYWMIPDDEKYMEAIVKYVCYKYWEIKWNAVESGAEKRMMMYKQEWMTLSTSVKGEFALPSRDETRRINEIIYANIELASSYDAYNVGRIKSSMPKF